MSDTTSYNPGTVAEFLVDTISLQHTYLIEFNPLKLVTVADISSLIFFGQSKAMKGQCSDKVLHIN